MTGTTEIWLWQLIIMTPLAALGALIVGNWIVRGVIMLARAIVRIADTPEER